MAVTLKNKPPVAQLDTALRRAGFKHGENLEFKVSRRKVTIVPREPDGEYAPPERRAIDKMLAESDKDHQEGRVFGPFNTAGEMAASIEANIKKLRMARRRRKAKSAR
jgi:hypothetical protein